MVHRNVVVGTADLKRGLTESKQRLAEAECASFNPKLVLAEPERRVSGRQEASVELSASVAKAKGTAAERKEGSTDSKYVLAEPEAGSVNPKHATAEEEMELDRAG